MIQSRSKARAATVIALALLLLCACEREPARDATRIRLEVWAHAGQESERDTLRAQVERFNRHQNTIRVDLTFVPEGTYNAQIQAAAVAGDLPDLLEFDGPLLYTYVWQGHLLPLEGLLSETVRQDLLPSIIEQGSYHGRLYSVGTFDSGLALYANRSLLDEIGARIPASPRQAWDLAEFSALLAKLAQDDSDGAVLDLKLNYAGEWYTYAFSPFIQSAGGDLIDRKTYLRASGALNSAASVSALTTLQSWIDRGYVDPNIDDAAFVSGRVALALGGHWNYSAYAAALGERLVLLPLPDFGHGARTGQGSWSWGITGNCAAPQAAAAFLEFLLTPKEVLAMADANGAVPGTRRAVARSSRYQVGEPLRLFVEQLLGGHAVPRPRTPVYPLLTSLFQQAFDRVRSGGDVKSILDRAAAEIDDEIEDNKGYPWIEPVRQGSQ